MNTKPTDYLDEFMAALRAELEQSDSRWGDTWLHRPRKGQERRISQWFMDKVDQYEHAGRPIRWESVAGQALIAWVREHHPELFPD